MSGRKFRSQVSCLIEPFVDQVSNKVKYSYQCQLFLVNRDRMADNVSSQQGKKEGNDEAIEELPMPTGNNTKLINKIILFSNVDQLKTLANEAKDTEDVILKGCPRIHNQTKRGSIYRGVSKNGKKWQVMVMGNNCKYFSGSIMSERLAARIYDRFALQHFGLRAKTNLDYNKNTLLQMINEIQTQIIEDQDFEGNNNIITLKGVLDQVEWVDQ